MNSYFCIFECMERNNKDISKRVVTFRNSDSPLTSERARVIISNRKDSVNLAKAVRSLRHNEKASFKVTNSTETKIQDLQKA